MKKELGIKRNVMSANQAPKPVLMGDTGHVSKCVQCKREFPRAVLSKTVDGLVCGFCSGEVLKERVVW